MNIRLTYQQWLDRVADILHETARLHLTEEMLSKHKIDLAKAPLDYAREILIDLGYYNAEGPKD